MSKYKLKVKVVLLQVESGEPDFEIDKFRDILEFDSEEQATEAFAEVLSVVGEIGD